MDINLIYAIILFLILFILFYKLIRIIPEKKKEKRNVLLIVLAFVAANHFDTVLTDLNSLLLKPSIDNYVWILNGLAWILIVTGIFASVYSLYLVLTIFYGIDENELLYKPSRPIRIMGLNSLLKWYLQEWYIYPERGEGPITWIDKTVLILIGIPIIFIVLNLFFDIKYLTHESLITWAYFSLVMVGWMYTRATIKLAEQTRGLVNEQRQQRDKKK